MIRDQQDPVILDLCRQYGPQLLLQDGEPNGACVLYALFLNERYIASNPSPRFEPAYYTGGRYCNADQQARIDQYGKAAACSYSNWQLMYPTSCELGFHGAPVTLDDDATAIAYVMHLINRRIIHKLRQDGLAVDIREVGEGYNSGNPEGSGATAYAEKLAQNYETAKQVLGC